MWSGVQEWLETHGGHTLAMGIKTPLVTTTNKLTTT